MLLNNRFNPASRITIWLVSFAYARILAATKVNLIPQYQSGRRYLLPFFVEVERIDL